MNIWIIHTHWLWDSIVFSPIIKKIKEMSPDSEITLFTWTDFSKEFYKNLKCIDKVIVLDKNNTTLIEKFKILIWNFKKYDVMIDTMRWDSLTSIICRLFWKESIWFSEFWKFYTIKIPQKRNNEFIFEQHIIILKELFWKEKINDIYDWNLDLKEEYYKNLENKIWILDNKIACLHASSKKWYISRKLNLSDINKIIDYLIQYWYSVYLIWSKDDEEIYKNIKNRKKLYKVYEKNLSIWETASLIKKSDVYIWTNSWPMRIAAALQKKAIIINWPTKKCRIPPKNIFPNITNILPEKNCCSTPWCDEMVCKFNKNWIWICMKNINMRKIFTLIDEIL